MDTGDSRQFRLEMRDGTKIRVVFVEITEGASQERKEFRLVMIPLGANLDQLDKVGGRLRTEIILADSGKWIF